MHIMKPRRAEEVTGNIWFRSERVFRRNGDWYFRTREDIDVGPYASEFEAQVESSILKHNLDAAKTPEQALQIIREFLLDSVSSTPDLKRTAYGLAGAAAASKAG